MPESAVQKFAPRHERLRMHAVRLRTSRRRRRFAPVRVPVVRPSRAERLRRLLFIALILVSLLLHFGGEAAITSFVTHLKSKPVERIQVAVYEHHIPPPPPPPPAPEPEKKPEVQKVTPVKPKIVRHDLPPPPKNAPIPPPQAAPPPPNHEAPAPTEDVPVIAGISMESTSSAGAFAVNTGNTLYGSPSGKAAKPEDVKPYKAQQYVPSYAITEAASCSNNLSDDDLKKFYPAEALQLQIEQQVQVRVTIDDDGSVVKVEVLKDPGHGFAEAAKKVVAHAFRCKPGKQNGKPVATEITSTLNFELPN